MEILRYSAITPEMSLNTVLGENVLNCFPPLVLTLLNIAPANLLKEIIKLLDRVINDDGGCGCVCAQRPII